MRAAIFSLFVFTNSRNANKTLTRFVSELWRHSANASVAAFTATSTVAAVPNATFFETSPVAGLKISP